MGADKVKFSLKLTSDISPTPERMVVYGAEGTGKTSFAAFAPDVVFLYTESEDGIHKSKINARVPKTVRTYPPVRNWLSFRSAISLLSAEEKLPYNVLVIDAITALEAYCQEYICDSLFKGDWGSRGFAEYGKGYEATMREWAAMLTELDAMSRKHMLTIILLAHAKIRTFENPEGPNYDRVVPALHDKTWAVTHRWADTILNIGFREGIRVVDSRKNEGKAIKDEGRTRRLVTMRTSAVDAKNRCGLPPEIELPNNPSKMWSVYQAAVKAAIERSSKGVYEDENIESL